MASILDTIDRPHRGDQAPRKRLAPAQRIQRNTRPLANGCIEWTGRVNNCGYGHFTVTQAGYKTATFLAHRVAWEVEHGRIPEGLVVDHLCRNRLCVNTAHMELVTRRENTLRSPVAPAAVNAAKTHCPQGHPYDETNTRLGGYAGRSRYCRACEESR